MKYFSMFSGIGGFELGIGDRGECIGFSEIDSHAAAVYKYHFNKHKNHGDCTKIIATTLPEFDLLVGGFPCQSFSVAGKRRGFEDTRGTLFFDIARIAKEKRPKNLLLENVQGLLYHDKGNTLATILSTLDELGYTIQWCIFNSKYYGVPQSRDRIYIAGYLRGESRPKIFYSLKKSRQAIEKGRTGICSGTPTASHADHQIIKYAGTLTAGGAGHWARCGSTIIKTNEQTFRRLTPIECERLQGFPDNWTKIGFYEKGQTAWTGKIKINAAGQKAPQLIIVKESGNFPILESQRYKMCGNAVTVNVIKNVIGQICA